jgi:dephospho-CoA kinase
VAAEHPETTPRILGLTGPIACGKSTIGTILLELGALDRIDADEVVHELMAAGTETTRQVEREFGAEVIAPTGAVDRAALGARVFADQEALRRLEQIVHPAVRLAIRRKISGFAGQTGVVVLDAVKLLQSDLANLCSTIWVVNCTPGEELRRLREDRGMSMQAATDRIAAQPDFDDSRVSHAIDNSGRLEQTKAEVRRLWNEFTVGAGP